MPSDNPRSDSTTSLASNTYTVSSTVPLNPSKTPQKDYAAALGNLQSRYGAAISHGPTFTPVVQQKAKDPSQSSSSQSQTMTSGSNSESSKKKPSAAPGGAKKKRLFFPWKGK
ncbi:hypothetical protein GYMLUDRAFT_34264 [Collybiopsis luxurians FD-317 M1]|nr:hypothetical protein GYMLUDRAFT_34264 [Collybiopsis luxurians FD-317 M1]